MGVINLWKTLGGVHFPIHHLLIKAEVSWEETLPLLQARATRAHTGRASET